MALTPRLLGQLRESFINRKTCDSRSKCQITLGPWPWIIQGKIKGSQGGTLSHMEWLPHAAEGRRNLSQMCEVCRGARARKESWKQKIIRQLTAAWTNNLYVVVTVASVRVYTGPAYPGVEVLCPSWPGDVIGVITAGLRVNQRALRPSSSCQTAAIIYWFHFGGPNET